MIIIHAVNDLHVLPRLLQRPLDQALRSFPVVVVTGSRQTGKSTLVHSLTGEPERPYRTLDDLEVLDRSRHQPEALVRSAPRMTLDERSSARRTCCWPSSAPWTRGGRPGA